MLMAIFGFFILFIIVGWFIALATRGDSGRAGPIILVITVFWAFISGPWAIATFFELLLGFIWASNKNGWTDR